MSRKELERKVCLQCKESFACDTEPKHWARRRFCEPRCYGKWSYYNQRSGRRAILAKPNANDLVEYLLGKDDARIFPEDDRYAISRDGRVFSRAQVGGRKGELPWKQLRLATLHTGYKSVSLGKRNDWTVHTLVTLTFIGMRPTDQQIRHLDGDPSNNCINNLAYGTAKQNGEDTVSHGRSSRGRKQHLNKLTESQVFEIRMLCSSRAMKQRDIANVYGISQGSVQSIVSGKSWKWLT